MAQRKFTAEMKNISIKLPMDTFKMIKNIADSQCLSVVAIIRIALKEYAEKNIKKI